MKWSAMWKKHGFFLISAAFVVLVVIASISIAKAAGTSVTVTWVHPVTYATDGSALDVADIKETVITWRRPGSPTVVGSVHVPGPATQTLVTGLVCGSFNFTAATVVGTSTSVETSPVLYATGIVCAPNPPTNLKVT